MFAMTTMDSGRGTEGETTDDRATTARISARSTASEIPPSGSRHLFETCQPTLS